MTNPVADTVATFGDDETQGVVVAAVPLPVSCDVDPVQADNVPVIVGEVQVLIM